MSSETMPPESTRAYFKRFFKRGVAIKWKEACFSGHAVLRPSLTLIELYNYPRFYLGAPKLPSRKERSNYYLEARSLVKATITYSAWDSLAVKRLLAESFGSCDYNIVFCTLTGEIRATYASTAINRVVRHQFNIGQVWARNQAD